PGPVGARAHQRVVEHPRSDRDRVGSARAPGPSGPRAERSERQRRRSDRRWPPLPRGGRARRRPDGGRRRVRASTRHRGASRPRTDQGRLQARRCLAAGPRSRRNRFTHDRPGEGMNDLTTTPLRERDASEHERGSRWHLHWTVGRKVAALGMAGLLAALLVMGTGQYAIRTLKNASEYQALTVGAVGKGLTADAASEAIHGDVLASLLATDPAGHHAAEIDAKAQAATLRSALAGLEQLAATGNLPTLDDALSKGEEFLASSTQTIDMAGTDPANASTQLATYNAAFGAFTSSLDAVNAQILADSNDSLAAARASAARARAILIALSVIAIAGVFIASRLVIDGIVSPLGQAVAGLRRLADADLTGHVEVRGDDEVGQLATSF